MKAEIAGIFTSKFSMQRFFDPLHGKDVQCPLQQLPLPLCLVPPEKRMDLGDPDVIMNASVCLTNWSSNLRSFDDVTVKSWLKITPCAKLCS